ncbi:hypothetical protein PIB30_068619 [Stylosanthes scabra]|uniref:Uncharacterized protein n=1 Tax=Stylosanthes scabra TaxID=79078 RepID=A0ABU6QNH0_9FABA|nr:hypothetical protein [Stylosanthes scabra]
MIDASSGDALMNKTPEEAWELIETVADANQHFNRRATSKGVYELQYDNTVASTHNFFDATTIPPYNKQYYTQGGCDGQPTRWNPPQQPQAQPIQPYTYNHLQNCQNPRYQPPYNRNNTCQPLIPHLAMMKPSALFKGKTKK